MTTYYRIDADGYLNGVDTEPRDNATWLTVAAPQVTDGQYARWTGSEWEITEPPPSRLSANLDRLWRESWAWGDRQLASVDRSTIVGWAAMGELTPSGIAKVRDLIRWLDALFGVHYATAKAAIAQAGEWVEPDWASWPPVPWTWADIIAERVPNAQ